MSSERGDDSLTTQIREAIGLTIADLDDAGLTGEDRAIVLRAVLAVRLGGGIVSPPPRSASIVADQATASTTTLAEESDTLSKVARAMKLDRELLEYVYDDQEGVPVLVISAKKLSDKKSEATKTIAQLVAAARQAAGVEDWTSSATIRGVVSDFGRLDTNNFAAALQGLDKVALSRGKGTSRELKITRAGMEEVAGLIVNLVGEAS